jgi:hypothetical protein
MQDALTQASAIEIGCNAELVLAVIERTISMRPQSNVIRKSRVAMVAASGLALALGLVAIRAQADPWNKKTTLTISQPMQVTDTYLEPGSYVFKLLDSQSDRHIVQIYNADQTHLITTILAVPDYRVQVTGKSRFTMWETPAGHVNALRSWYYPGDNFGQEFRYPKNLRQVEVAQTRTESSAPLAPQAEPAAAPEQQSQAPEQQAQAVIAQDTPPPAPAAVPEEPAQTEPESTPAVLPKTASPYPLIGFIGVLLIGLGGLLRQTRSA